MLFGVKEDQTTANKPRRSNSRNEQLLNQAAHLFAVQGFKSTSMRDIAESVGMLPGSIYYHFPSKDDLLLAIYEAGVNEIPSAFEASITDIDDPWQRLEAGMAALILAITDHSPFTSVIFKVKPAEVARYEVELIALRDEFERLFNRLIADLPLAPWVEPRLLSLMLLGAGNHAQLWFKSDGKHNAQQIGAAFSRFVRQSVEES